jgi:hypothetical protein
MNHIHAEHRVMRKFNGLGILAQPYAVQRAHAHPERSAAHCVHGHVKRTDRSRANPARGVYINTKETA